MITYVDTSVIIKLLVDDESGTGAVERLWLESEFVVCAEIGYVEARAALAAAHRTGRLDDGALAVAKNQLDTLWEQIDVVPMTTQLGRQAGDLAETEHLRGYDAVHLAAAIVAHATVFASADARLLAAAHRQHFDIANPTESATTTGEL